MLDCSCSSSGCFRLIRNSNLWQGMGMHTWRSCLEKSYSLVVGQETSASKDKQREMTDSQVLGCLMVFILK